jgi:hypothetical protein
MIIGFIMVRQQFLAVMMVNYIGLWAVEFIKLMYNKNKRWFKFWKMETKIGLEIGGKYRHKIPIY